MTYIFHRKEGFYPVDLPDDKVALDCVPCNPGTIKVERIDKHGIATVIFNRNEYGERATVYWNSDYETYEYIHPDGYIEVFRDNIDAKKFADKNKLKFNEKR